MELLAPAGGREQLEAAVRFGADAVYLAAERFGMRARAANFALEDIPEAIAWAHEHGVKVHVTCNILMHDTDISALPDYFCALDAAGADALIIGDLGAAVLAREHAPHTQLHVSTQASVANAEAAKVWHGLGASRIVCAREMSLSDIARLREAIPAELELEAFAHGAMCMAVSGRCLISAYLTGRSGNKGHCTQPCRWSYTLEEEKRPGEHFPIEQDDRGTFIMNAKDLNMLAHLDELRRVGIDAIKIEGRNKKAFFVASVVNAYRHVLDGEPASAWASELEDVSHRPYGTGFYFDEAEQACDYDGYEQQTLHVADIVNVESGTFEGTEPVATSHEKLTEPEAREREVAAASVPSNPLLLTVRCRNRFEEGDELEVLAPGSAVQRVRVRSLCWLPEADDMPEPPEPVAVANRSAELYRFVAEPCNDGPLFITPGSFLRRRCFRRSSRSALPDTATQRAFPTPCRSAGDL